MRNPLRTSPCSMALHVGLALLVLLYGAWARPSGTLEARRRTQQRQSSTLLPQNARVRKERQLYTSKFSYDGTRDVRIFLAYLKKKAPQYSSFARLIETTGFDYTLIDMLKSYAITVMVPQNSVIGSKVTLNKYMTQQLGFNVLVGRWEAKMLQSSSAGAQFLTFDCYPKSLGVYMYKLPGKGTSFGGVPYQKEGAAIVQPNLFVTKKIVAHGVSKFLPPYRNFG